MTAPSPAGAFFRHARGPTHARRPWLRTANRTVTYGELCDRIEKIGGLLKINGVAAGDRVVTALADDVDASVMILALICHGATGVQIDPATKGDRAKSLIDRARPGLTIIDEALWEAWGLAPDRQGTLVAPRPVKTAGLASLLGGRGGASGLDALLKDAEPVTPPDALPGDTLAYILFTSGTTSQSKGVCIGHRALFAHLDTLSRVHRLEASSQILNTLMLSHADGLTQGPALAFVNLACLHRPLTFEVGAIERLLDAVFQLRITHMIAVPTMLSLILRLGAAQRDAFQGGDFRYLVSCGAQLEPTLWQDFEETFGVSIINVYGLTETVTGGVYAGAGHGPGKRGAIGVPVDCELRIVDAAGADVAEGEMGELLMWGDLIMTGYFDDPVRTAEALKDGWFHTGDIARRDEDGEYWICGRKKSVIIRGGLNVHPEEIVEVLNRNPLVSEAIAFGEPDADWGETITAIVATSGDVSEEDLLEDCRRHLEPRKVPTRIVTVAALPKGRSGKIIIEEAKALAAAPAPARGAPDSGGVEERVLAAAAQCFGQEVERVSLRSTPQTVVGWDSLAHLNLVFAIEKAFSIRLSPREIMGLDSLEKVAALVRNK